MHALEELGKPPALTLDHLKLQRRAGTGALARRPANRRALPHRLEECGYVRVQNRYSKQGLWRVNNKKQAIYARSDLCAADRLTAAKAMRDPGSDLDEKE